jgi:superoxide reductase
MADAPLITLVTDFAAAGDFEKKHTPFVKLDPQGDMVVVNIEVGHEVAHPNEVGHYITFIELFAGMTGIARFDFSPEVTSPRVCVPVSLPSGTLLRAVAHCNLHGWWGFEITL